MIPLSLVLATALLSSDPQAREPGVTLERDVKLFFADTLGRLREIHRRERLQYQNGNILIEDLTFGEKLLIRSDRKKIWKIDTMSGTYSELTFDQVLARQSEALKEIEGTIRYMKGTQDEREIRAVLQGYGRFEKVPTAELRVRKKTKKVLGRTCRRKDLYVNGNIRRISVYVDESIPGGAGYFATLARVGAFSKHEMDRLKEMKGFPLRGLLRYVLFLDRVNVREEPVSIKVGKIPLSVFDLPKGLKLVPLKGFQKPAPVKIKRPKGYEKGFKEDDLDRKENSLGEGDKKDNR